ncbi:uncharacterized protein [Physeter macrocephalus]|uniref:Uncharacterized protein isoform X2 n=1 Tax=Physeter macrocephalus TaxID=9755 RepID=A0A9W2W9V7_PHYMC|nr:uncharacterized protein LOC129391524 isoform X2 [Physeter catodon]
MDFVFSCLGCHHKVPQTRWLKQQKVIVSQSGGQKFEIKVLAGLVSSEASLPPRQMAVFSLDLHMGFSVRNYFDLSPQPWRLKPASLSLSTHCLLSDSIEPLERFVEDTDKIIPLN